jgi:hypothetical protein
MAAKLLCVRAENLSLLKQHAGTGACIDNLDETHNAAAPSPSLLDTSY